MSLNLNVPNTLMVKKWKMENYVFLISKAERKLMLLHFYILVL